MNRAEKTESIASLTETFSKAKAVILAEYSGLKVSEITEIRREVRRNEGEFRVVKNRLARRAIIGLGSAWAPLDPHFVGPIAIATTYKDAVVLSKLLAKHAESFAALKLKVALVEGKVYGAKEIEALTKLPSAEELYARLLGTLVAPISGALRVLKGVPQKLGVAVKAIADGKK